MSSSCSAPSLQLPHLHASSRRHPSLVHPLFFTAPSQRPRRFPLPPPALPRRLFQPSGSFVWDAITGGSSPGEASSAVRRGMLLFGQGDVSGSLAEFDRAMELDPRQKACMSALSFLIMHMFLFLEFDYVTKTDDFGRGKNMNASDLWQRGLSLYYLNRFEEGAEQFRIDVAANPNDTEESIWCFLCEAQLYGVEEARRRFLQVGRDPRPFMREAYNMFKDGGDPEKFLQLVSMFSHSQENEFFYASLYAGLYYESQNDSDSSKRHILAACKSPYGVSSGDYMAALTRVHCLCRNWTPDQ